MYIKKTTLFIIVYICLNHVTYAIQNTSYTKNSDYFIKHTRIVFEREKRRLYNIPVTNWFVDQVNIWAQTMENALTDKQVTSNLVLKKLQNLFKHVSHIKTEKQSIEILHEALKNYALFQKSQNNNEDKDIIEYFHCVILAKNSIMLVHSSVTTVLTILDKLTAYKDYWIEQQRHPSYYYFHKSPLKWFDKEPQYIEMMHNKKIILKILEKYNRVLGQLIQFIHTFDAKATVEKQYKWLYQLTQITNLMVGADKHVDYSLINFEKVTHSFITQYMLLANHFNKVLVLINNAKKPIHIMRHWITYSALASIATYCYCDPQKIIAMSCAGFLHWCTKKDKEGQTFFERWVKKPCQDVKNVILNGELPEKWDQHDNIILTTDNLAALRKETLDQLTLLKNGQDLLSTSFKTSNKQLISSVKKTIDKLLPDKNDEQKETILRNCIAGDMTSLYDSIELKVENIPTALAYPIVRDADANFKKLLEIIINAKLALVEKFIRDDFSPEIIRINTTLVKTQLALLDDAIESMKNTSARADWMMNALYDILKKHDLSLKILALVPAGAVVTGLFKGIHNIYTKLFSSDYTLLNTILCDIEKVLIKSTDTMEYGLYGNLIHLLHRLKISAQRCIWGKNDVYYKFIGDIHELESYDYTSREKEKLIVLMRQRYDCLRK